MYFGPNRVVENYIFYLKFIFINMCKMSKQWAVHKCRQMYGLTYRHNLGICNFNGTPAFLFICHFSISYTFKYTTTYILTVVKGICSAIHMSIAHNPRLKAESYKVTITAYSIQNS